MGWIGRAGQQGALMTPEQRKPTAFSTRFMAGQQTGYFGCWASTSASAFDHPKATTVENYRANDVFGHL
jgi:hypothetical protein